MIEHVYGARGGRRRPRRACVVLTDDERIARVVEAFGGERRDDAGRVRERHRPHRLGGAAVASCER